MGESGDLAHTIYIERGDMRAEGSEELRPFALRVTQIYRREAGDWKIIHRHADPMTQPTESAWFKQEQP
jgi:ketosteroid isomerase-like protein